MAPSKKRDLYALVRAGTLGHAVGDALGVPVEFTKDRETLRKDPVREMRGGGRYDTPKGSWSDDTSMTIAFMQSYIDKRTIDLNDIMTNFVLWLYNNDFTPSVPCFGTGRTCTKSIERFVAGVAPKNCGGRDLKNNGNGSLMRILPVAYICYEHGYSAEQQFALVTQISSLTHAHPISILACQIYVNLARALLDGATILEAYRTAQTADYSSFSRDIQAVYNRILHHTISHYSKETIDSDGYVKSTLECSLWSLLTTSSYESAVEKAISLGQDTDTNAAVTGGLAGIYYGFDAIPTDWLGALRCRDDLLDLSDEYADVILATRPN